MVAGNRRAGSNCFGDTHSIFHKKNFAAAARKGLFAGLFGPVGWSFPQFFILHQLDGDVAKGLV